jgi:hypothetical protein
MINLIGLKRKDDIKMDGWIGVDLDGTLAEYNNWQGAENIGEPIPLMVERVKKWINEGKNIKIFTARASSNNPDASVSRRSIQTWCLKHLNIILPITAEKDYGMIELWDDRCKQVIPNTGILIEDLVSK